MGRRYAWVIPPCLPLLLGFAPAFAASWLLTTPDSTFGAGRSNQIVLNDAGLPHLVYWHVQQGVRHAWFDGTAWQNESVEMPVAGVPPAAMQAKGPTDAQLLINVQVSADALGGTPMLAYSTENYLGHSPVYGPVRFGVKGAGAWSVEDVGSLRGYSPRLALSPTGDVHIICIVDGALVHATQVGGDWQTDTVYAGPVDYSLSLAVNASGAPIVAYSIGLQLHVATRTPSGWQTEALSVPGFAPSLALDRWGEPRISFVSGTASPYTLQLAEHGQSGWVISTLTQLDAVASSIALDPGGRVRIVYGSGAAFGSDLYMVSRDGGPWVFEPVDTLDTTGGSPSLAIGGDGHAWIGYNKLTGDVLRAAVSTSSVDVEVPTLPPHLQLRPAGPNPLHAGGALRLALEVATAATVHLELLDSSGRRRGSVDIKVEEPGRSVITWPELKLESGMYFVRARTDSGVGATARIVILH